MRRQFISEMKRLRATEAGGVVPGSRARAGLLSPTQCPWEAKTFTGVRAMRA